MAQTKQVLQGIIRNLNNRQSVIRNSDPYEYQKKEFGEIDFSFDVIKNRKEEYADVFSEGSESLKKLLCYLWENNIETAACCTGHKREPRYTKKTIFGEKEIDEKTYLNPVKPGKYSCYEEYCSPYILLNGDNKSWAFAENIKTGLEKQNLEFSFYVEVDKLNRINIGQYKYLNEENSNRFFDAVLVAVDHAFCIENKDVKKEQIKKFTPQKEATPHKEINELIQSAAARISVKEVPASEKQQSADRRNLDYGRGGR